MALASGPGSKQIADALRQVDWRRVVRSYDRASDALMVHLFGRARAAVSVPLPGEPERDFVFLRFDPETDQLVGLQIEDFLDLYVRDHPEALALLDRAKLRGITAETVAAEHGPPAGRNQERGTIEQLVKNLALAS